MRDFLWKGSGEGKKDKEYVESKEKREDGGFRSWNLVKELRHYCWSSWRCLLVKLLVLVGNSH